MPRPPAGDIMLSSTPDRPKTFQRTFFLHCFIIPSHHILLLIVTSFVSLNFFSRDSRCGGFFSGDPRPSRTDPSGPSDWPLPRSGASSLFSGTTDDPVQRVAATSRRR